MVAFNQILNNIIVFLKEMAKVTAAQAVVDVANEVKVIASMKNKGVVLLLNTVLMVHKNHGLQCSL